MTHHITQRNLKCNAMSLETISAEDMSGVCGGTSLPPLRVYHFPLATWIYNGNEPSWVLEMVHDAGF